MLRIRYDWSDETETNCFGYAVIVSRYQDQWIFVRRITEKTYELPAGHREAGETILETARRELYEETGARQFDLEPICSFFVYEAEKEALYGVPRGMLYYADIKSLGPLPESSEIGEVVLSENLPDRLSYPDIQPQLLALVASCLHYQIRPARQEDGAEIYYLNHVCLGSDYPEDQTRARVAFLLSLTDEHLFVAEEKEKGRVVGYIHLSRYECTHADRQKQILTLAIDEDVANQQIGLRLLGAAEQRARAEGAFGLLFASDDRCEKALSDYEACGYQLQKNRKVFIKLLK